MKQTFILTILILCICSCEQKNDLTFDFQVTDLLCFPDNDIRMTFNIIPDGGDAPYLIKWIEPDNFQGEGPFTCHIESDI
ncbi:MAG TPA: hypothetical protein ENN61_05890, partial [Bacteroidaceae bacterium]|nr:hypothetical protein [Bacteroidaceae bacterium]